MAPSLQMVASDPVAGLVQTVNETAQIHEARLKEAYRQLESLVNQETRMVFWFSRTWIYLLTLVCAGFMGALLALRAEDFVEWVNRSDIGLVGEYVGRLKQDAQLQGRTAG